MEGWLLFVCLCRFSILYVRNAFVFCCYLLFFVESRLSRQLFLSCMLVVLKNILQSILTLRMENSFGMS